MTVSGAVIGVLGGSGIYDIEGLSNTRWERVSSPFGEPSDELFFGDFEGQPMVFLPRHGRGHRLPPDGVNYRANIDALKRSGVTDILSLSAVGSFKDELSPGMFVLVDQFIDRTTQRDKSFFGPGVAAHVSMAHPVCPRLGGALEAMNERMGRMDDRLAKVEITGEQTRHLVEIVADGVTTADGKVEGLRTDMNRGFEDVREVMAVGFGAHDVRLRRIEGGSTA